MWFYEMESVDSGLFLVTLGTSEHSNPIHHTASLLIVFIF